MNESVLNCARQFSDSGKLIAAICHGPLILAAAGLLKAGSALHTVLWDLFSSMPVLFGLNPKP
jgi:putative intracellular protease/amidase